MNRTFTLLFTIFSGAALADPDSSATPSNAPETEKASEETKIDPLNVSDASISTEGDARVMEIAIPAPRGLILDREGRPFAQTKMAYHLAIDFTAYEGPKDPKDAFEWSKTIYERANYLLGTKREPSELKMTRHYKNRRWLPIDISPQISENVAKKIERKLIPGLTLLPVYQRFYPQFTVRTNSYSETTASHIIGYVGADKVLPVGTIRDGDPLFKSTIGKAGLEKALDEKLRGTPGIKKMIFDKNGHKVLDEIIKAPRPGNNLVTTLDLDWQKYAETILRRRSRRGAFVVIDIQTGEVLVMASRPSFNLNDFVPYISTERYKELVEDERNPLFGRAYQAAYPPASTFKPIVMTAGIASGNLSPWQKFDCPYKIKIGYKWFRNHSQGDYGWIGPKYAMARSNNPYFIQAGIKTGPQTFLSVARRFGFGSKTGLPLIGETPGRAPSAAYIEQKEGRPTTDGDTANLAIGQGHLTASPLQVAQGMAALGNGNVLMQLQLVKQIQDFHGRVIEAPRFSRRNNLNVTKKSIQVSHDGMRNVVHADYGTGKKGDVGYVVMAGKTGTAQWIPHKRQNLAWFAGFLPYKNPRYAFAAVYEGRPGQTVSGGKQAAPIVRDFFKRFQGEILANIKNPVKAILVDEEEFDDEEIIPEAIAIDEDPTDSSDPADPESPVNRNTPIPEEIPEAQPVIETPGDTPRSDPEVPADNR